MNPIRNHGARRTGPLAALGLCLLLLLEPGLRGAVWAGTRAVLGSDALFRGAFFLETGLLPGAAETGPTAETAPPAPETVPVDGGALAGRQDGPEAPPPDTAAPAETGNPPAETAAPAAPADPGFRPEEAEAIGFRGNCTYETDKAALLCAPLDWQLLPGPKVLILHSHACEAYTQTEGHTYLPSANYRTLDPANNVVAVGDALAEALAALGVEAIHDRSLNDYPSYNSSYAVAREKIADYLEAYPSIVMVLDLHRDALDKPVREAVEAEGQTLAPLMLVVGTDQGGLSHPHWQDNLSCALKLQALGNRDCPGLFKKLSFRKERFNGDMTRGSLIVEVGSTENTLPEAIASMPCLARCVAALLAAAGAE